jgi:MFS superfamily sulfate permease-like transporter
MTTTEIPKDGLEGLKENWKADALSGFLVFLIALPLSLGIAKASGFASSMGVLTAMVGGLVVSALMGGRLTIKGPAAGLITVCAGAVADLTGLNLPGVTGVQLACGAIVVMSVIQIVFGFLKFGSFSDFFPHSVVHGMLAAIGILIFAKQFPILLGVPGDLIKGSPIELYEKIPFFIQNATPQIALIGILSLIIIFGLPAIGGFFKKIPAPMVVLIVMIPFAMFLDFKTAYPKALVSIGNFWQSWKDGDSISIFKNVSFDAIGTGVFWKYVIMFLFVNSLESLLTVKAIDGLDPWRRKSDYNKDLRGLALGNGVSGLLGGLPMISEVARSSANVVNGARTRWANFFHGVFLLVAMLLLIPVIEMIPTAALAAMLISVAYRLASPKEFIGTYKIGPEQLVIFLVTIIVTVAEDLLMGVAAGIVVKFIFHIINGAPLSSLFKAQYTIEETDKSYLVNVKGAATFSNFLGHKKAWATLKPGKDVTFNFEEAKLVDHSFMDQLHHFEEDRHHQGGHVTLTGLEKFNALSSHPLAARKIGGGSPSKIEIQLTPRQIGLRKFAESEGYLFHPQRLKSLLKYKDFPIQKGNKIQYEENFMEKYNEFGKISISDITLTEGARQARTDTHFTVVHISETDLVVPDFALEPEGISTKLTEMFGGKDIDFREHPEFSDMYYLRGHNEEKVREFFAGPVVEYIEKHRPLHIECHRNRLLFYKKLDLLEASEIHDLETIAEGFLELVEQKIVHTI